ncbi:hypothetical protein TNIN_411991 [Trichonephila inaurata madagascariensis]|uniref:Uncharacterized protein n=1 Tax=Trichonephila inaurata madagascariensis TaxID=2747483 RepID=A0A8X6XQS6_9ARAC|nr:hypothetical protein TNIN_411991 [Trichonephila inaurata madagascariensis]
MGALSGTSDEFIINPIRSLNKEGDQERGSQVLCGRSSSCQPREEEADETQVPSGRSSPCPFRGAENNDGQVLPGRSLSASRQTRYQ